MKQNKVHFIVTYKLYRWHKYFYWACNIDDAYGEEIWSKSGYNRIKLIPYERVNTFNLGKVTCKRCLHSKAYKKAVLKDYEDRQHSLFRGRL